jgi:hypothetical protein
MALAQFSPPGQLTDLSRQGLEQWTARVSDLMDNAVGGTGDSTDSPRAQFFNPHKVDIAADVQQASVFWIAFPKTVRTQTATDHDRWAMADSKRGVQDEYCEWAVQRNAQGKIVNVTFTCETPEYWDEIAQDSQDKLLALYRELAGPEVQLTDLIKDGHHYDRQNRFNSGTAPPVHLTQSSNNLWAAIDLSAAATIVRVIDGRPLTSEQELIKCSGYGESTRNSDPHIGASINALARERADVTLADPPGLYISDFTPSGFKTPDASDPKSYWTYSRGEKGLWMRGVYEVPADKGFVVGDMTINDQPIEFGAQIADFVSVKVVGLACNFGKSKGQPFTVCKGTA